MGYDDIKKHGFDKRTADERQELARIAGKASGEARRRKADFRKTLNQLLTTKIDHKEWTPILESLGIDPTLESAMNMKMIMEALAGNVQAAKFVAQYAGQSGKSEPDEREQQARVDKVKAETERTKAETEKTKGTSEEIEYMDDMDEEIYGDG